MTKLRRHLLHSANNHEIQDEDALHSVPIKEMSNYDEYPRANGYAPPLREIDAQPVRQHVFGNPFKVNKVRTKVKVRVSVHSRFFIMENSVRLRFPKEDCLPRISVIIEEEKFLQRPFSFVFFAFSKLTGNILYKTLSCFD